MASANDDTKSTLWGAIAAIVVFALIIFITAAVVERVNDHPLRLAFPVGYTANRACLVGQSVFAHQPVNEGETGGAKISDRPGGTLVGGKVVNSFGAYEDGIVHLTVVGWVDLGSPDRRLATNPSPERQGRYWFYVFSDTDSRHGWVVDAGIDDPATGESVLRPAACQLRKV